MDGSGAWLSLVELHLAEQRLVRLLPESSHLNLQQDVCALEACQNFEEPVAERHPGEQ